MMEKTEKRVLTLDRYEHGVVVNARSRGCGQNGRPCGAGNDGTVKEAEIWK